MGIESTLNWSKMTCIDCTLFEMADEQPRLSPAGFHPSSLWPSVYMASNVKKKCKLLVIKKHLGRGNFVVFSNLFHRVRERPVVSKLKQDSCHEVHTRLCIKCSILTLFPFLLFESKSNVEFCHKNFLLLIISHYHWTRNRKSVTDEIWNPRIVINEI